MAKVSVVEDIILGLDYSVKKEKLSVVLAYQNCLRMARETLKQPFSLLALIS